MCVFSPSLQVLKYFAIKKTLTCVIIQSFYINTKHISMQNTRNYIFYIKIKLNNLENI